MARLQITGTNVLKRNLASKKRIKANQGSTGSSKTYSLAQLMVILALKETGKVFSIVRKSLPTLKATAMKDLIGLLKQYELYNEENHNKTDQIYRLHGNVIEFFGLDDPQKVRSRRRNYLWLNEANEFSQEDWRQLSMRTSEQIFLDYNPSDMYSWIYDDVLNRDDCELIVSTYKDNPFLPKEVVAEIEGFKEKDENFWKIYGLGQRGTSSTIVYTHWRLIDDLPEGERIWGLDFGFNNPSALVEVIIKDNDLFSRERLYQSHMTNQDLISVIKDKVRQDYVYCDAAEPQRIEELKKAGINAVPADKSVRDGIDAIKQRKFYITSDSVNMIKEVKRYSWKTKGEQVLDKEPVKAFDHALDACRYAVYTHLHAQIQPSVFFA